MRKSIIVLIISILLLIPQYNVSALNNNELEETYRTEENKVKGEPYLNPMWVEWNNLPDEEKTKWEVIPQKLIVDYVYEHEPTTYDTLINKYNLLVPKSETYPSTYNLKDEGYVSPIKNQSTLGLCWDFATIAAIESNALKTLGKSLIFSERQIDYALSNPATSITEGYNPYGDSNRTLGDGGNFSDVTTLFMDGISPQLTSVWGNYSTSSTKQKLSKVINNNNVEYQVTNTVQFPYINMGTASKEEKNSYIKMIKKHIMNYGGVYISTITPDSRGGSCYNSQYNMSYKYEGCTTSDTDSWHAMLIIGWNDTYGPDYNGDGVGDGAWILKNSWGSQNQYPYVSYYSLDSEYNGIISIEEKNWDNNYNAYDLHTTNILSSTSSETIKTFKYYKDEKNKEILNKISFFSYADKVYSIYLNQTDNIEDNILIGQITTDRTGIYSIDTQDIELINNSFTVTIKGQSIFGKLNVYTSDYDESTEKKVSTYIKNDFVDFNKTTSSSIASFELATFTKNIETGTEIKYKIYKENTDITNLFTIPKTYIINDGSLTTIEYDKSIIEYGNYKVETYINNIKENTYNFTVGAELIKDIYVPSKIVLSLGETRSLPIKIKDSSAYDKSITYTFLDNGIVSIDESGKLTAEALGKTTLHLSTNDYSDIERNIEIEVRQLNGVGTINNPYLINDKYELYLIKNNLSASYKLTNNITFNEDDFEPNGDFYNAGYNWYSINNFTGIFDGNNKNIKGLRVYIGLSEMNMGLFGKIEGATIKNITFENCSSHATSGNFGIVAGMSINSTFENITVLNSNITVMNKSNAGAIVGSDESSTFKNISSLKNSIGGISGNLNKKIGGIVGVSKNTLFNNISNTSTVYGGYLSNVGGIVGESNNATIINSTNSGNIKISYASNVPDTSTTGGIVGTSLDSTIISSNNDGAINGRFTMGGIVGKSNNTYIKDVYNNGAILPISDKANYGKHSRQFYVGAIIGYSDYSLLSNVFSLVTYDKETIKSNDYYCSNTGCTIHLGGIIGYGYYTQVNNYYSSYQDNADNSEIGYNSSSSNTLNNKISYDYIKGQNFGTTSENICTLGYNCNDIWEKKDDIDHITLKKEFIDFDIIINGKKGDTISNIFYPYDNLSSNLKMSSYNTNYLSINQDEITLKDCGTTTFDIGSKIGSDFTKKITINIIDKTIEDIVLEKSEIIIGLNENIKVKYYITPEDASIKQLYWETTDNDIATVDQNGNITGVSEGTTMIRVKSLDGSNIEKTIKVTVVDYDIKTDKYNIDENLIINKIKDKLLFSDFITDFTVNSNIITKVFNNDTEIDYTKSLGTGYKLKTYSNAELINEYTLIVSGDLDGNGSINAADIMKMKLHILGKSTLNDVLFKAGDVNDSNSVNATDIIYLKRYILGKSDNVWSN